MFDAPVGFAFSAGAVAAFNPCGFALLPAYLGLFLAGDDEDSGSVRGPAAAVGRAAAVAACVVAGFVLVFGIAGLLISQTAVTVQEYTPWLTLVIGGLLVPAGFAMLRGWTPKIRLPKVSKAGKGTGPMAMFWFGVSYATVSLSCTIPAFLVAVVGTFSNDGAGAGLLVFVAYTAGMASVLVVITVIVATAQQGMLAKVRKVLPYVNKVAGVLAILAGSYVFYYGYYELRLNNGGDPAEGPISFVGDISGDVTTWVDGLGVGAVLGTAGVVAAIVAALWVRSRRSPKAADLPG
ncbi:MAG: cytochrome c biogenesis CcdA family protein [Sporichthyaceae bacterium]